VRHKRTIVEGAEHGFHSGEIGLSFKDDKSSVEEFTIQFLNLCKGVRRCSLPQFNGSDECARNSTAKFD